MEHSVRLKLTRNEMLIIILHDFASLPFLSFFINGSIILSHRDEMK